MNGFGKEFEKILAAYLFVSFVAGVMFAGILGLVLYILMR